MFDKGLLETDAFMDMPMASKALYFLLGMEADDEGFVSPGRVMRIYGGNPDDLKVLIAKNYVIQFKSGVIVITDWNENNYLDKNRIKETKYQAEKQLLTLSSNKYRMLNKSLTDVKPMLNQYSIGEYSISNNSEQSSPKEKKEENKMQPLNENFKWQLEALEAIKLLSATKKSSIFKCYKDNSHRARFALNDCKELGKLNELYFLKIYNELIKK